MGKKPKFLKQLRLPVKDFVCLKEGTGARKGGEMHVAGISRTCKILCCGMSFEIGRCREMLAST